MFGWLNGAAGGLHSFSNERHGLGGCKPFRGSWFAGFGEVGNVKTHTLKDSLSCKQTEEHQLRSSSPYIYNKPESHENHSNRQSRSAKGALRGRHWNDTKSGKWNKAMVLWVQRRQRSDIEERWRNVRTRSRMCARSPRRSGMLVGRSVSWQFVAYKEALTSHPLVEVSDEYNS